jgi:hypothetical protein
MNGNDAMTPPPSPWFWGVLYCDHDDPRLFVPQRTKTGWTINWGNPRAPLALLWVLGGLVGGALIIVCLLRVRHLVGNPMMLLWWAGSVLAATAAVRLNTMNVGPTALKYLGLGIFAFFIGLGCQRILNGGFVTVVGSRNLTWAHHLYLGPVAGICQTFGKLVAIALVWKTARSDDSRALTRCGLVVGLGFALTEITYLAAAGIFVRGPMTSVDVFIGIWERTSSSVFHIYAAGLVAVAVAMRRKVWLAGANATLTHYPVKTLELIFTLIGVLTWLTFWLVVRRVVKAPDRE